jgi:hypothetical protein
VIRRFFTSYEAMEQFTPGPFAEQCPSPEHRKEPKNKSRQKIRRRSWLCGEFVFPRHIESVVPGSRHLKGWFSL